MDDTEKVEQPSVDETTDAPEDETTDTPGADAEAAGDDANDAMDALKGFGAALGGVLRAAASTPEAEELKKKARTTAASVGEDIGSKAGDAEDTDAGQKLKAGTASLLGAASSALSKAAESIEVPASETPDGESHETATTGEDATKAQAEDGAESENPPASDDT